MTSFNQDMALKLLKNFINLEFLSKNSKFMMFATLPDFCDQALSQDGVDYIPMCNILYVEN